MQRSRVPAVVFATALVTAAAACGTDRAIAPRDSWSGRPAGDLTTDATFSTDLGSVSTTSAGGTGGTGGAVGGGVSVTTLTVNPRGSNTYVIGVHKLFIPANTVCDPATSSYGPGTWDDPCTLAADKFTVMATSWTDSLGHPYLAFQPALRFRPSAKGSVTLYMMDKKAVADPTAKIVYCSEDALASSCVDESAADPSLATHTDATNGFLWRILKHFSGYNIVSG